MICPKCKKKVASTSKFCGYCGKKFRQTVSNSKVEEETKTEKTKISNVVSSNSSNDYISSADRLAIERSRRNIEILKQPIPQPKEKDASVIGRGIVGGLVAGPAGAVVGALSAIDKNKKKK